MEVSNAYLHVLTGGYPAQEFIDLDDLPPFPFRLHQLDYNNRTKYVLPRKGDYTSTQPPITNDGLKHFVSFYPKPAQTLQENPNFITILLFNGFKSHIN